MPRSSTGVRRGAVILLVSLGLALWHPMPGAAVPDYRFMAPAGAPAPPSSLEQRDVHGALPLGELLGEPALTFEFQVIGQPGDVLVPEVELRPVNEPFSEPNLQGGAITASGLAQFAQVGAAQPLGYHGFHWRARVRRGAEASAWVAFGDNRDATDAAHPLAEADFYNLYEPLTEGTPPVGFDALVRVAALPLIVHGVETRQVSSFDRSEANQDGGSDAPGLESYFYRTDEGDVLLETSGPGQISRIWFAEDPDPAAADTRLLFYFDGAAQPGLELTIAEMLSGARPPFVRPLVLDPDRTSGGWLSYVPLPFRSGVKVVIAGPYKYYQITYQRFASAEGVSTFTGREDYSLAQTLWQRLGRDPKPTRGNTTQSAAGALDPGATALLADLHGPGVLQSLTLRLPQLVPSIVGWGLVEDSIRTLHGATAQFSVRPALADVPTRLRLRRNCQQLPQATQVTVNGVAAGAWTRSDGSQRYPWCEDSFDLTQFTRTSAAPLTIGLTVSDTVPNPWAEATYWLDQHSNWVGPWVWRAVDVLDAGNSASEQAHGYAVSGATATSVRTFAYPPYFVPHLPSEALLAGLRLRITADGAAAPQVDAPVGAFFGSGAGETDVTSLLAGINPWEHLFYSFWPMPFNTSLRVELVNGSAQGVTAFDAQVAHAARAYPAPGTDTGYFQVVESPAQLTRSGVDHPLAAVAGAGRLVGVHLLVPSTDIVLLEGDERTYVDGERTPGVRGTGTEDMFNGGWYYNRGRSLNAVAGANATLTEGSQDQYRWYLSDFVPFSQGFQGGVEHGGDNQTNGEYASWSYFYLAPRSGLALADPLDLADAAAGRSHALALSGPTSIYTLSARFEGASDTVLTAGGVCLYEGATLQAIFDVDPDAAQVVLRRLYDQGQGGERLGVWVDGILAGEWLDGGRNAARRWRESTFLVPPELTRGRYRVTVGLQALPWDRATGANLAQLTALSLGRVAGQPPYPTRTPAPTATLTATPTLTPSVTPTLTVTATCTPARTWLPLMLRH